MTNPLFPTSYMLIPVFLGYWFPKIASCSHFTSALTEKNAYSFQVFF